MKIRIIKNKLVEVEKTKLQETWDTQLKRWDELNIESIVNNGKSADLFSYDGDVYINVPIECFEVIHNNH